MASLDKNLNDTCAKRVQTYNVSTEKLLLRPSFEKAVRKMLVKLTPVLSQLRFSDKRTKTEKKKDENKKTLIIHKLWISDDGVS